MIFQKRTDRAEFSALIKEHEQLVAKVARSYAKNREDQQDLSQEIWLQAYTAFPRFDHSRRFSTWLFRIALNVGISYSRRRHRELPSNDLEEAGAADAMSEDARELYRIIDGLDELNRALLLLVLEEYSHEEIAEIVGLTQSAVTTRISRLKSQLKSQYGDNNGN